MEEEIEVVVYGRPGQRNEVFWTKKRYDTDTHQAVIKDIRPIDQEPIDKTE